MKKRPFPKQWIRFTAFVLVGVFCQFLFTVNYPKRTLAQAGSACAAITNPLTPEEQAYAQSAWNYFVDNSQPTTGFSNSAGGYPSGTLWDLGNYLTAMNAARWMGLIDQAEFDQRLNTFLNGLSQIQLFEGKLPNKVYNSATGEMVDYGNNPLPRGIGWSALDIGRILAAFHVLRTCHPQYSNWLQGLIDSWQVALSVQDDMLYGATVLPDDSTLLVQEGRLGYEEYAARGYQLWGFNAPKALAFDPYQFVDIYGVQIPVDTRTYQETNANNYVVSESYILEAIEFGLNGELADYANRVFEAQKRRFEDTGLLTAVSEDNINQAPYFLYSTVYSNGVPWAVITEANELHPELRTLSTKAAFGWHYVYPENDYAKRLFDQVKDTCNSGRGFYAGIYESGLYQPQPPLNDILTGNTNGLLVEILYYKARGYQPLIAGSAPPSPPSSPAPPAPPATLPPPAATDQPSPAAAAAASPPPTAAPIEPPPTTAVAIAPVAPVGQPRPSSCPLPEQPLRITDERYAKNAWNYFDANYQPTGLVNDRSDMNGATLWGLGDYLAALHAAQTLGIISAEKFDQRVRQLLGALRQMPLFAGELPHRSYDTLTLNPIDYGGNDDAIGNGWSGLDVGRLMAALHVLKTCHPEYADVVDTTALDWSYLRVVRNGQLSNAVLREDANGRSRIRVNPSQLLGYEEYAARAFQLWGFDVSRSAVGGQYQRAEVEGQPVPVQRADGRRRQEKLNTISTPFILYGLEFGFDPQMRSLVDAIFSAEKARYQRTGTFSASGTTLIDQDPYVIHNTIVADGQPWPAVTESGTDVSEMRLVSTAVAFAYFTLFPNDPYSQELWQATLDLYNPLLGYYEGFYEQSRRTAIGFTGGTNSLILQALLHKVTQQPLIQPHSDRASPWWQAIRQGDSGQGLPETDTLPIEMVSQGRDRYWVSTDQASSAPPATEDLTLSAEPAPLPPPAGTATAIASPSPDQETVAVASAPSPPADLSVMDKIAAQRAWKFFENNWNATTGLVNAVDNLAWSTVWDQGSALLGLHAARQLDLISASDFNRRLERCLQTLTTLPLPETALPNKAYNTATAAMYTLSNTPDPQGRSGWSALDICRFLISLKVLQTHYPDYSDRIEQVVRRFDLSALVSEGWLVGSGLDQQGNRQTWQEGRLGYEQYAAAGLLLWGQAATNALYAPPIESVTVDGVALNVDQRDRANSGASNYLTNDPYFFWGLELGWPEAVQPQVEALLQVQQQRYARTQILTALNEDALDRPPYFLYYCVYADGNSWRVLTSQGVSHPDLKFLSTKAAFAWSALKAGDPYGQTLRQAVQNLADENRGYLSGRYEDPQLGPNRAINVNTNAAVLESLLYHARGGRPLIQL
ncbi:DUF3131 domain-containing protein [Almyronema epifaneia]|uniref:DUF3131 domain-containing protein n=1 Tax=Almyronema epifaneia S1 TaxID=2991925 RepID=A0ABW6IGB8_9CYAN